MGTDGAVGAGAGTGADCAPADITGGQLGWVSHTGLGVVGTGLGFHTGERTAGVVPVSAPSGIHVGGWLETGADDHAGVIAGDAGLAGHGGVLGEAGLDGHGTALGVAGCDASAGGTDGTGGTYGVGFVGHTAPGWASNGGTEEDSLFTGAGCSGGSGNNELLVDMTLPYRHRWEILDISSVDPCLTPFVLRTGNDACDCPSLDRIK